MNIRVRSILLDIEGTTSSISFVYDVMFPYVRDNLEVFLRDHWDDPAVRECLPLLANDIGISDIGISPGSWPAGDDVEQQQTVTEAVLTLMDDDVKATGLKRLQGLIWKEGFKSGQLVAHVFDDVPEAIRAWNAQGIGICIYSSGSVQAQQLFFGHTIAGDLLPLLCGYYDTTIGDKRDWNSYAIIARDIAVAPEEILFISDVAEELEAAHQAGMQTLLSIRPGNKPVVDDGRFESITDFGQVQLLGVSS